jgi:membrane associated rhomboid family serine protease
LLPLKDENPISITPFLTWLLIGVNVIVFIFEIAGGAERFNAMVTTFGFVPAKVVDEGAYYMFLTSMFLHGGILHLGGNMLYLYIFGDNIEDLCGHLSYLIFYLVCGFFASLAYMLFAWGSETPAVGASGAISGILGAYVSIFPNVKIKTAIGFGWLIRIVHVPAYVLIGLWFIYQLVLGLLAAETGVAYWAHIGGFAAGVALAKVYARRKRYHPLYRKEISPPYLSLFNL